MAQVAIEVLDIAIQIGTAIAGAIQKTKSEQDFRNAWTPKAAAALGEKYPGKNIMLVYTAHDASKLNGVKQEAIKCDCGDGTVLAYVAYSFDDGVFVLQGDGGYLNWAFQGNFQKNGNTVTFSQTDQAKQMAAAAKAASDKAAADKAAAAKKAADEKQAEEDKAKAAATAKTDPANKPHPSLGGNSQPIGTNPPDSSNQPGGTTQPGETTQPSGTTQTGGTTQPGETTQPGGTTQPGETAQPDGADQSDGNNPPDGAGQSSGTNQPGGVNLTTQTTGTPANSAPPPPGYGSGANVSAQYGGAQYGTNQYGNSQYGQGQSGNAQVGGQYGNSQYGGAQVGAQYGGGQYGNTGYTGAGSGAYTMGNSGSGVPGWPSPGSYQRPQMATAS